MPVLKLKRRSRMVNFRLSEEEYEKLASVCRSRGARSVSEFARKAVLGIADLEDVPAEPPEWGRKIECRVEELAREVKRLNEAVDEVRRKDRA